ncbi:MAG: MopE-related protein, partial [Myxococcales bacterium]|nr:MopE-related protein [Myxococcales bacterium]
MKIPLLSLGAASALLILGSTLLGGCAAAGGGGDLGGVGGGDAALDGGLIGPDGGSPGGDGGDPIGPDASDGSLRPDGASTGRDGGPGCVELEACGNGLDDDCDLEIDEGCGCLPGEESPCFGGPAETRGLGECADGVMVCTDALEFGAWGACIGQRLPGVEICDIGLLDEDCDGAVNEDCECIGDEPVPCGSSEGVCVAGYQECVGGLRTACTDAMGPQVETCNGLDDDCDGAIDEELVEPCGSDLGECRMGTRTCIEGAWEACSGGRAPQEETCDDRDNDCDGSVDEDLLRGCGSDLGTCTAGTQRCVAGAWSFCSGAVVASAESCNGLDDDCDGAIDEDLARSCGTDVGACQSGTQSCRGGAYSVCEGLIGPTPEICDGLIDDDCDGTVDNGCGCTSGTTRACGSDTGACVAGTESCDATGAWRSCAGATGPSPELCNGIDDDCDGSIDEGLTRSCGTDLGICALGLETCAAGLWGSCVGEIAPSLEL